MLEFFREGGWGMWPVLASELVALGSAALSAGDMETARLRFAIVMTVLVGIASLHATLMDVAAVFSYVQDTTQVPDAQLARVLCLGLMESTRPCGLAGIFVVLSLCLVAVGVQRDGQRYARTGRRFLQ